jgi:hypothetical protein
MMPAEFRRKIIAAPVPGSYEFLCLVRGTTYGLGCSLHVGENGAGGGSGRKLSPVGFVAS